MSPKNILPCYPGYRYCGPGCSGPGLPTNPLDACCKAHDECYYYHRDSRSRRYCDMLFQQCLDPYYHQSNKMGKDARLFSRAIRLKNYLMS